MQAKGTAPMLIQTKLNRPPLPVDMVRRPRLTKWLKRHQRRPLTLISAPAGYGKSTLISCWLSSVDCPTAWVSLDEHDNQMGNFLSYFLAAIQTIFPNALPETQTFLTVTPQPSTTTVARTLINELNQIEEHFILVLDDYHLIENQSIHDLLSELFAYRLPHFHLVLGTRMDPPLPLISLRAKNQMTEIRIQDLRFTQEETQKLFQEMIGASVDPRDIDKLNVQAEGWVTGLRLAALAWRHRIGVNAIQGELSARNRYVSEYLFNEILERQAATLSICLLKTSILNRFCAELCETVCFSAEELTANDPSQPNFHGADFLEWLQTSNLFVIPLDDQGNWFRYHHLFQEFLQQQLDLRFSPEEVHQLHAVAGCWFADNLLIEEALYHLLSAGEISQAIELVAQHRYKMVNQARWSRLESWLNLFPGEVIETSPELWMLKILLVYHRGRWIELPAMLERLEAMLADEPDQKEADRLQGEFLTLKSLLAYFSGDAERALSQARKALELTASEFWALRVFALLYVGLSLQMLGDEINAQQVLYRAFEEERVENEYFKANVLMMVCFIHWISADLQGMDQAAKQSVAICQAIDYRQILGYSQTLLGFVRYQQNDLSASEELFAAVVARPYMNYGNSYINSVCGLAMTYQAIGKEAEARQIIERAIAFILETGNTTQLPVARALQAEAALRQGSLSGASQWANQLDPVPPFAPVWGFFSPHLTLVKIWLAQNTSTSQAKAADLLSQLEKYFEGIHNTRFLIETLALQALLKQLLGDQAAALAFLEKALRLAQPGGFIRLFVDLGLSMRTLLSRLQAGGELGTTIDIIKSAFPQPQTMISSLVGGELLEPLTFRELQVLELLAERLTNKEIADKLVVSPGTVKGHTIRIYDKLDVNGRREAVEKAVALGILSLNKL